MTTCHPPRLLPVWLLALLSLACADAHSAGPATPPVDPYPAAYDAGRAEVEAELAQRDAKWLRVRESDGYDAQSGLDRETGLPWVAVDPADPATPGRVAGHNEALREYAQKYGLPETTRQPWEKELFDLRAYVAAEAKANRVHDLVLDGHAGLSDDRQFAVAWRRLPTGSPEQTVLVQVVGRTNPKRLPPLPATRYPGKIRVAWGPAGSDFAVLHWTAPGAMEEKDREGYSALDLRSGLWLRHESPGVK